MNPLYPQYHCSHYRLLAVVLAFMLSLASVNAHAEALTDNKIRAFMETLENAQAMEPDFEQMNDSQDSESPDFSKIFSSSIKELKGEDSYDRLEAMVQNHGFKTLNEWATTGDRIYSAWIAIEMADQSPALRAELQSAMAEIESNPNMTAQQKAQMRAAMEAGLGFTQQAGEVSTADIEAVKPHLEALRSIGEQD